MRVQVRLKRWTSAQMIWLIWIEIDPCRNVEREERETERQTEREMKEKE